MLNQEERALRIFVIIEKMEIDKDLKNILS